MPSKTPPLRVLFVSHTAELNGAEQMLLLTLKALDRKKFAPSLAVPAQGPLIKEAERARVPVHVVPGKWWLTPKGRTWKQPAAWVWNIPSVLRLRRLIRREEIGLVFTNSAAAFSGALAARSLRVPHVWSVHEILRGRERLLSFFLGGRMLARLIRRLSKTVIVNSRATGRAFARQTGVEVVPNGLELKGAAGHRDDRLRKRLGLAPKDVVLGVIGKITPAKGQRDAIRALALLSAARPELKLLVVGLAGDDKYFRELQEIVREQGLEGKVAFTGFVADVFAHLRLMDLLLIVSRTESFGRTAIEAMAAGVPVLAVSVGGLPEVVIERRTGFLVKSTTPEVLGHGIDYVLDNPATVKKIVRAGRLAVKDRYEIRKLVKKVERIMLESARPGGTNA